MRFRARFWKVASRVDEDGSVRLTFGGRWWSWSVRLTRDQAHLVAAALERAT